MLNLAFSFVKYVLCNSVSINYIFSHICKFFSPLILINCFMLSLFFGNQRSLASYIKKFACSNAKTEDLWAALEEGSDEPVNKLMNSWTRQKGYPVITIEVKDQKLVFEQVSLLSGLFHLLFLEIAYLNPDAF